MTLRMVCAAIAIGWPSLAAADFVEWILPGTNVLIPIEGSILKGNITRGTISIDHPKYGKLIFSKEFVARVHYTADQRRTLLGVVRDAYKTGDADAMFAGALPLLKRAWLAEYYATIEKILEIKSDHPGALRVQKLRESMAKELPEGNGRKRMQEMVKSSGMAFVASPHFLVMHDLGDEKREADRDILINERLKLLERVFETFMLFFFARGAELEIPAEKMHVVFFREKRDYQRFATSLSPFLQSAAGFWDPDTNISFFFNYGTDEIFLKLNEAARQLREMERTAKKVRDGDFVRFSKAMNMLVQLWQEEQDISLITHEATHQIAGSTGLLPRSVRVPFWIHEGLAMHFESPKGASWAGIGSINEERLDWYRRLADNQKLAGLNFIVGDELFNYARAGGQHSQLLDAYGQGWALTHFLLDRHFDETVKYYKMLGSMPRELMLTPETLRNLFDHCFAGTSREQLQNDFHRYMNQQKTDYEKACAVATKK